MEIVPQGLREEKEREVTEEKMTRRAWKKRILDMHQDARYDD